MVWCACVWCGGVGVCGGVCVCVVVCGCVCGCGVWCGVWCGVEVRSPDPRSLAPSSNQKTRLLSSSLARAHHTTHSAHAQHMHALFLSISLSLYLSLSLTHTHVSLSILALMNDCMHV
ncbi:MAG TPA: hypothetical protein V6C97_14210 [Oculatellaceae cyanobacterium]